MRWSYGSGIYGPIEDTITGSWSDFISLLTDAAQIARPADSKESSMWVTPMVPKPGTTRRRNEDCLSLGSWIGLDLDRGAWSIHALRAKLMFSTYFLSTTTSSTPTDPHWRIMLLCDREFTESEHARLFRWLLQRFNGEIDSKCRNCSRVFFLPATWDGTVPVTEHSYGRPLRVDNILSLVPEEPALTPLGDAATRLRNAPDGTPIITNGLMERAQSAPPGGRMFKLMTGAATRFRREGWNLTAAELAAAALVANAVISPNDKRRNILNEAQNAIDWARDHHPVLTPIEKMRQRVLWERTRR